ncbi:MAG: radical SAM protein [Planctomycetota bacterium]
MDIYSLQRIYRRMRSPQLKLAAIRTARTLGIRHLMVRIDTNDACNLRCVMCTLSAPGRKPIAKPMSTERFAELAKQLLPRTRFLYLSCATEPLATPHFDEILDVAGSHRVPFLAYATNGHLLKTKFIEATLRNGVDEVIFSVDGATKATYEAIRVGGRWENLEERLREFTAARRAWSGKVPTVRFNFTAQKENVHEVTDFARWAMQWDPATIQIRMFMRLQGAVKQDDDVVYTTRRLLEAMPEVERIAAEHGAGVERFNIPDHVPEPIAEAGTAEPAVVIPAPVRPRRIDCQLPWFTVYVKTDGAMHPCSVHPAVGNVFESSYRDVDRGAAMRALRSSLRSQPKDICIDCQRSGTSGV